MWARVRVWAWVRVGVKAKVRVRVRVRVRNLTAHELPSFLVLIPVLCRSHLFICSSVHLFDLIIFLCLPLA
jgi:hypothetical protein